MRREEPVPPSGPVVSEVVWRKQLPFQRAAGEALSSTVANSDTLRGLGVFTN